MNITPAPLTITALPPDLLDRMLLCYYGGGPRHPKSPLDTNAPAPYPHPTPSGQMPPPSLPPDAPVPPEMGRGSSSTNVETNPQATPSGFVPRGALARGRAPKPSSHNPDPPASLSS